MQVSESRHTQEFTSSSAFSNATITVDSPSQSGFTDKAVPGSPSLSGGIPAVIPPADIYRRRTLILCFDGTGDQFDSDNSNIVEFFSMLKKDDSDKQMCYYQAGIGTYTSPQVATPFMAKVSKTLDEMVAWNLGAHVMDGYEFLMQNYKSGDRICIFGFSRGAYTARALAGMIHKVGLLPSCNHQQVPFAFKMFTRADELGWKQSTAFKKAFSVDVEIEFVGVWDTVNSVGLIPRRLPFTTSNTIVRTFRHAIALDERRSKFKANHWNQPSEKDLAVSRVADKPKKKKNTVDANAPKKQPKLKQMEREFSDSHNKKLTTDIEEVWFAGCHCDVGGGSVENETPHSLARIPLRWMIRECFKTNTGIMFYSEGLQRVGLDPGSLYPFVRPRNPALPAAGAILQDIPTKAAKKAMLNEVHLTNYANYDANAAPVLTEEEHDLLDAMSPVYDQLSLAPGWWVLELIPIKQRLDKFGTNDEDIENSWSAMINRNIGTWNLGRGRVIPRQKKGLVKVHRSVKLRMEAEFADKRKYVPKASFERAKQFGNLVWVD
ncbi:hypothetical protein BDQ17DRAFT_1431501 [Cyathus striatus]|nr:hypothetical protein BDQ17DRAFT_1431501 [Cyathus striatus]